MISTKKFYYLGLKLLKATERARKEDERRQLAAIKAEQLQHQEILFHNQIHHIQFQVASRENGPAAARNLCVPLPNEYNPCPQCRRNTLHAKYQYNGILHVFCSSEKGCKYESTELKEFLSLYNQRCKRRGKKLTQDM